MAIQDPYAAAVIQPKAQATASPPDSDDPYAAAVIQPGKAGQAYKAIAAHGVGYGFQPTSGLATTGHNPGSKHYTGDAEDFSVQGKSPAEVDAFIKQMQAKGYTVRDERVRPTGQQVWDGAHIHVETGGSPQAQPQPRVNLTALKMAAAGLAREITDFNRAQSQGLNVSPQAGQAIAAKRAQLHQINLQIQAAGHQAPQAQSFPVRMNPVAPNARPTADARQPVSMAPKAAPMTPEEQMYASRNAAYKGPTPEETKARAAYDAQGSDTDHMLALANQQVHGITKAAGDIGAKVLPLLPGANSVLPQGTQQAIGRFAGEQAGGLAALPLDVVADLGAVVGQDSTTGQRAGGAANIVAKTAPHVILKGLGKVLKFVAPGAVAAVEQKVAQVVAKYGFKGLAAAPEAERTVQIPEEMAPAVKDLEDAHPGIKFVPESSSPVAKFKTSKGSTYEVQPDGTTIRAKAARPDLGHEGQSGLQPKSDKTVYIDPADQEKLARFQAQGGGAKAIVHLDNGQIGIKYLDGPNAGMIERSSLVDASAHPSVGKMPVELWQNGEKAHFGNEITEVGADSSSPTSSPAQPTAEPIPGREPVSSAEARVALRKLSPDDPRLDIFSDEYDPKLHQAIHEAFGHEATPFKEFSDSNPAEMLANAQDRANHDRLMSGAPDELLEYEQELRNKAKQTGGQGYVRWYKKPGRGWYPDKRSMTAMTNVGGLPEHILEDIKAFAAQDSKLTDSVVYAKKELSDLHIPGASTTPAGALRPDEFINNLNNDFWHGNEYVPRSFFKRYIMDRFGYANKATAAEVGLTEDELKDAIAHYTGAAGEDQPIDFGGTHAEPSDVAGSHPQNEGQVSGNGAGTSAEPSPEQLTEPAKASPTIPVKTRPTTVAPEVQSAPQSEAAPKTPFTGTKNAITSVEHAEMGRDPVIKQAFQDGPASIQAGKDAIASGEINPRALAVEIDTKPRIVSATERGALGVDRVTLKLAARQARNNILKAVDDGVTGPAVETLRHQLTHAEDQLATNTAALQKSGREWAASGRAMQVNLGEDYSIEETLDRARANKAAPLTDAERKQLEEATRQLDAINQTVEEQRNKIADLQAKMALGREKQLARSAARKQTRQELDNELASILADFQKNKNVSRGRTGGAVSLDAPITIAKVAKNRIRAGALTLEDVIDQTITILKEHMPGITERDVRDALIASNKEGKPYNELGRRQGLIKNIASRENRVADLEALKPGEYEAPGPKEPVVEPKHIEDLKNRRALLQARIDQLIQAKKPKTFLQKATDIHRAFILSGLSVFEKLGGASLSAVPVEALQDFLGAGFGQLRAHGKSLASVAEREGLFSPGAEAAGVRKMFSKESVQNAYDSIKLGMNAIDVEGGQMTHGTSLSDTPGRLHGATKAFLQTGQYNKALRLRLAKAAAKGLDITDETIRSQIGLGAALDAQDAILKGPNAFSKAVNNSIAVWDRSPSKGARALGAVMKTIVPIVKVPANYLAKAADMTGLGLFRGGFMHAGAALRPAEELSPQVADSIIKAYKRGGMGLLAAYIGLTQPDWFKSAGFFDEGSKGNVDTDGKPLEPGSVQVMGAHVPQLLTHNPFTEAIQFWASVRRAHESTKDSDPLTQFGEISRQAVGGMIGEAPGLESATRMGNALAGGRGAGKALGAYGKSLIIPQILQQGAEYFDRGPDGKPVKRQTNGVIRNLQEGAPILRNQLPKKEE